MPGNTTSYSHSLIRTRQAQSAGSWVSYLEGRVEMDSPEDESYCAWWPGRPWNVLVVQWPCGTLLPEGFDTSPVRNLPMWRRERFGLMPQKSPVSRCVRFVNCSKTEGYLLHDSRVLLDGSKRPHNGKTREQVSKHGCLGTPPHIPTV